MLTFVPPANHLTKFHYFMLYRTIKPQIFTKFLHTFTALFCNVSSVQIRLFQVRLFCSQYVQGITEMAMTTQGT